jgi:hypothetical protein
MIWRHGLLGVLLCLLFNVGVAAPKIYLFLGGDSPCNHLALLKNKAIAGAQVIYSWRRLEPRKDFYHFAPISKDLSCVRKVKKKLFVQLQDRSFSAHNIPVPDYLLNSTYKGGVAKQLDNPGEGKPKAIGWVAKQWVPAVRLRFQKLIHHLGNSFDGQLAGINLPETAIDTPRQNTAFCQAYFNATLENLLQLKAAFPHTQVVQYVNFFPCEWNNSKGYMKKLFTKAIQYNIGLGNPDTVPYKKAQMHNSYQFFHAYHNQLVLTAIAVQEPDYTYTNFKTANKFTVPQLYYFAKDYLGADVIFSWCPAIIPQCILHKCCYSDCCV